MARHSPSSQLLRPLGEEKADGDPEAGQDAEGDNAFLTALEDSHDEGTDAGEEYQSETKKPFDSESPPGPLVPAVTKTPASRFLSRLGSFLPFRGTPESHRIAEMGGGMELHKEAPDTPSRVGRTTSPTKLDTVEDEAERRRELAEYYVASAETGGDGDDHDEDHGEGNGDDHAEDYSDEQDDEQDDEAKSGSSFEKFDAGLLTSFQQGKTNQLGSLSTSNQETRQEAPEVVVTVTGNSVTVNGLEVDGFTPDDLYPQPTEGVLVQEKLPESINSPAMKPKTAKPAIFADNSFHYTRSNIATSQSQKRDIYDVPSTPEQAQVQRLAEARKSTKAKSGNTPAKPPAKATKKTVEAVKRVDPLSSSNISKRRGRPPKASQQARRTEPSSVTAHPTQVQDFATSKSADKADKPGNGNSMQESSPGEKQSGGNNYSEEARSRTRSQVSIYKNHHYREPPQHEAHSSKVASSTLEAAFLEDSKEEDGPVEDHHGQSIEDDLGGRPFVKSSMKRKPDQPGDAGRPRKRGRTTSVIVVDNDSGADNSGDDGESRIGHSKRASRKGSNSLAKSSASQTILKTKPPGLIREVAAAEKLAREKAQLVKRRKRALKLDQRALEDAEAAAEYCRNRLAEDREQQARKERGLPPLESRRRKDLPNLRDLEDDMESDVERIEGVFGTKNLSHTPSVPFSEEEIRALIYALFEERKAGNNRFHNIWRREIFQRNNRSMEEVLANAVQYKKYLMIKHEERLADDPFVEPLDSFILSIPDTVSTA